MNGSGIYDRTDSSGLNYGHLIIPHRSTDQYDVTITFTWYDAEDGYAQKIRKDAAYTGLVSSYIVLVWFTRLICRRNALDRDIWMGAQHF